MSDVITGLHAVPVHVRDIPKARAYYRDILGLTELSSDETMGRATFGLPGTTTILRMHVQGPDEGGREPGTVSGVMFWHPDPVAACAEIKRRGGAVTNEPRLIELPNAKFTLGVIADPDGNEFVLTNRTDR